MPLRRRLATAALVALSGALVMTAMLEDLPEPVLILLAAAGAFLAGLAVAPLFGRPTWPGHLSAAAGAVIATGLGAGLAGLAFGVLAAQTLAGALIGPATVGQALVSMPQVLAVWVASMAGVQLVALRLCQPVHSRK